MKVLSQFEGVEFLKRCNKIRKEVQSFLKETNVLKIREHLPKFTGKETAEEKAEMQRAQATQNINDMLDVMLEEYPEKTIELFRCFIELEDGEPEPSGMDLVMTGMNIITDNRVMDFLLSLIRLGQMNTAV